jgi:hypothetical protein
MFESGSVTCPDPAPNAASAARVALSRAGWAERPAVTACRDGEAGTWTNAEDRVARGVQSPRVEVDMRVRWGRVAGTVATLAVAVPAAGVGVTWATRPTPAPVVRAWEGPDGCDAGEVLETLAVVHPPHGEDDVGGPVDEAAAAVLLAAARCARPGAVDREVLFRAFTAARHGVAVLARRHPDEAVRGLVAVWALAEDEVAAGPLVHAAVWTAVAREAADALEPLLSSPAPSPATRAVARVKLRSLAEAGFDEGQLAAREEQETWAELGAAFGSPVDWPWLPFAMSYVWEARRGAHPVFADVRDDQARLAATAEVLASAR